MIIFQNAYKTQYTRGVNFEIPSIIYLQTTIVTRLDFFQIMQHIVYYNFCI